MTRTRGAAHTHTAYDSHARGCSDRVEEAELHWEDDAVGELGEPLQPLVVLEPLQVQRQHLPRHDTGLALEPDRANTCPGTMRG